MALNCFSKTRFLASRFIKGRYLYKTTQMMISEGQPSVYYKEVEITFIKSNGEKVKGKGRVGDSLLDVVMNNKLNLIEGYGSCEGTVSCSTCHLIFKNEDFHSLRYRAAVEELDILEITEGVTRTSRLGCQISLTENMDGMEIMVPDVVNDARRFDSL